MIIDLKNNGTKFYFDEGDESLGWVEIRTLTSKVLKDITNRKEKVYIQEGTAFRGNQSR